MTESIRAATGRAWDKVDPLGVRWIIVACGAAGAALFLAASAVQTKTFESTVEVRIDPVSIEERFGAPDAPLGPEQAMARELQYLRSDAVVGEVDSTTPFDHSIEVERVSDDTIALVAQSISPALATEVAQKAATTYLGLRQQNAVGQSNASIGATQRLIDELTQQQAGGADVGAQLEEAQARLADFQAGQALVGETATITRGPTDPCCPVSPDPGQAAANGLVCGVILGLVIAAIREIISRRPELESLSGRLPRLTVLERDGDAFHAPWFGERRVAHLVLGALVLSRAAFYVVDGVNFIFDDWSLEALRAESGAWSSVPAGQDLVHARPGAWLTFTVLHGLIGSHPLVHFAVLTGLYLVVVLLLYAVFSRFITRSMALLVVGCWVILPIHNSMALWTGTSQITVCALLFLGGLLALTYGRWLPAGLGFAASILSYELSLPMAAAAAIVVATPMLPLLASAAPPVRPLTIVARVKVLIMVGLAGWWAKAHSVYPLELRVPSPATLWSAHFGIGLFGSLSTEDILVSVMAGLIAAGVAVCLVWWLSGDRARDGGPSLVVAGAAVSALGLYVSFTLFTSVLGLNDRIYSLSSIGAAMMLVGVTVFLWRRVPSLGVAFAVVVVSVSIIGQVVSLHSWSQAGGDTVALLRYIDRTYPDPASTHFIVGPAPSYRNGVVGISSPFGGADPAYRLRFPGATGSLTVAGSREEWVPTARGESLIEWSRVLGAGDTP